MTTTAGAVKYGQAVLEIKAVSSDRWEFEGFASVWDVVDFGNDRVARGAFRETLKRQASPLPLLWAHDQREIVGHALSLEEDAKGLRGRWKLVDTARGSDAYKLLKAGSLTGLSIGYIPEESDNEKGVRVLRKVSLMEVSLVPTPMLDVARVDAVKARAGHAKRLSPQLQRVLDAIERSEQREDWRRTQAQIRAMRVRLGY
jgi:hypothetical protein